MSKFLNYNKGEYGRNFTDEDMARIEAFNVLIHTQDKEAFVCAYGYLTDRKGVGGAVFELVEHRKNKRFM